MSNSDGMDAEREAFEQLTRRDSQDPASANDFSLFCAGYAAALRTTATAAQAEPVAVATFPPRIMEVLLEIADRKGTPTRGPWEDGDGLPLQDAADEAIAWISRATPQPPTAEPGQPSSAVDESNFFSRFVQFASEQGDHTPDSFAKGIVRLANEAHRLLAAKPPEQGRAADVAVSYRDYSAGFVKRMERLKLLADAANPLDGLPVMAKDLKQILEIATQPLQPLADSRGSDEVGV